MYEAKLARANLIAKVLEQMDRVWGKDGLHGEQAEYAWLASISNISEEDDVRWQQILEYDMDDLSDEDMQDEQLMRFLADNHAVIGFLQTLLSNYQNAPIYHPN